MDGQTAALIMLDLDNFKLVNDVFSPCVRGFRLSQAMQKAEKLFRADDIICLPDWRR